MLSLLKTVYGAVSKRGVSSMLTMMRIENGLVVGTNGQVTIGATVPELEHLNVTCPADKFLKAVATADATKMKIKLTPTGKLSITDGKFRAYIPTVENEEFPMVEPKGKLIECDGLIRALKALLPFLGEDAIRAWSNGVLLTNEFVYATNNVALVRYSVDLTVPEIVLPKAAVQELVRINLEPMGTVATESSITFILSDDVWLNSSLIDLPWPDVKKMIQSNNNLPPLNPELQKAVASISPFCPSDGPPKLYFSAEGVSTSEGATSSMYSGIELPDGCYHAEVLEFLLPSITHIDWTMYPKPCPFIGHSGLLEGIVVGMVK